MDETQFVIVSYVGRPIEEKDAKTIAKTVSKNGDCVKVTVLNRKDLERLVLNDLKRNTTSVDIEVENMIEDPNVSAIVVVGTQLKNYINASSKTSLVKELINKINFAEQHPLDPENRAFMNALFIITRKEFDTNKYKNVLKDYHITEHERKIMIDVYNFLLR